MPSAGGPLDLVLLVRNLRANGISRYPKKLRGLTDVWPGIVVEVCGRPLFLGHGRRATNYEQKTTQTEMVSSPCAPPINGSHQPTAGPPAALPAAPQGAENVSSRVARPSSRPARDQRGVPATAATGQHQRRPPSGHLVPASRTQMLSAIPFPIVFRMNQPSLQGVAHTPGLAIKTPPIDRLQICCI